MPEQTLSYEQYLAALPPDRRDTIAKVWQIVRENVPGNYVEEISLRFLSFKAGEEWYVSLSSQKNYISLYLIPVYVFPELRTKLDNSGKKLKTGKSCINFRQAEDLPLEVIGDIVGAYDAEAFTAQVRRIREENRGKGKPDTSEVPA